MNEADEKTLRHLNAFSTQSMQVLAAARIKAGQRGAGAIELGDLLLGLIVADQDLWPNMLPEMREGDRLIGSPPHTPFFSTEVTSKLLNGIEAVLPHSEPVGHTVEMPLSHEVQLAFDEAEHIQKTFLQRQIEPLHILASVLTQEGSQCVKLLQTEGITKELVLRKLNESDQSGS
jgi:Clp amino terminal domain, pathogenicity island component